MIRHLVLYKFKSDASEAQLFKLFTKLALLKDKVSGVHALSWGKCLPSQTKNAGYTYALSVDMSDESVFKEYSPHPLHMEVKAEMLPLLDGTPLMFDFLM